MSIFKFIDQGFIINDATKQLEQIKNNDELITFVEAICFGENKIQYNLKWMKLIKSIIGWGLVLMIIGVGFSLFSFWDAASMKENNVQFLDHPIPHWLYVNAELIIIVGFILFGLLQGILTYATTKVKKLSESILLRALSFKYGFSIDERLPERMKQFKDMHRGNYERTLEIETKGSYKGPLHTLVYYFAHLHYVDKVESKDKTDYRHYDRYYLFIEFPWVKNISLRSDQERQIDLAVKSKTASREFNKFYTLTGESELSCARFAKPITVLQMLKFKKILSKPNFTFSEDGWLCIGFNNRGILSSGLEVTLSEPEVFFSLIKQGVDLPKMKEFLVLVHELAEQHDDNFEIKNVNRL